MFSAYLPIDGLLLGVERDVRIRHARQHPLPARPTVVSPFIFPVVIVLQYLRAGACELVTQSMSNFSDKIDAQHAACVAVGNLANRHAENKKRLGTAGACNKVRWSFLSCS